jgi:hypothetical protein
MRKYPNLKRGRAQLRLYLSASQKLSEIFWIDDL